MMPIEPAAEEGIQTHHLIVIDEFALSVGIMAASQH
jgi:hypothetical protein